MKPCISIITPVYKAERYIRRCVESLLTQTFTNFELILVNDGSKPENLHYFEEAAAHPQVQVLHHQVNRGKGAALKTAFSWFLSNRPDGLGVVTVDGDNQHHPEDTLACTQEMVKTGKVILGCRDFSLPHVPPRSRFGNNCTCAVFKIFCGMNISDTQTGLRAIPRAAVEVFCGVSGDRFEYETNMLLCLKEQNIPYGEVKIRTVYIEENKSSHFRAVRDSVRIYALILRHFFRYTICSILSAMVDTGVFTVLSWLLGGVLQGFVLDAATIGTARVASSLFNFFLNKKLVFNSKVSTKKALLRYYMIAIPNMLLQAGLTSAIITLLRIPETAVFLRTVIYVAVMCVLFIATFVLQQRWVFANNPKTEE